MRVEGIIVYIVNTNCIYLLLVLFFYLVVSFWFWIVINLHNCMQVKSKYALIFIGFQFNIVKKVNWIVNIVNLLILLKLKLKISMTLKVNHFKTKSNSLF